MCFRLVIAVLCARVAWCSDARLSGLLEDQSGSVVPNALVTVRNEQTGSRRTTQSNSSGLYSIPSLQPGVYRVIVQAPGFETVLRESVLLQVGTNARLDFTMPIGDARTVVTITDVPDSAITEDASVGTLIGRGFIERMPLNGRGLQSLIQLTPGVMLVPTMTTSPGQFIVNGQRSNANYFTIDGVSANFSVGVLTTTGPGNNIGAQLGSGDIPALSHLGTFTNLVSPEVLQTLTHPGIVVHQIGHLTGLRHKAPQCSEGE